MKTISGILETVLYAADLDAVEGFYRDILGLDLFTKVPGRHLFYRCGNQVLLIFNPEATRTLSVKTQRSKVDFNVFEGRTVKGLPSHTVSRGALVWADGDLRAVAGHGQYVRRPPFGAQFEAMARRSAERAPTAVAR